VGARHLREIVLSGEGRNEICEVIACQPWRCTICGKRTCETRQYEILYVSTALSKDDALRHEICIDGVAEFHRSSRSIRARERARRKGKVGCSRGEWRDMSKTQDKESAMHDDGYHYEPLLSER